MSSGGRLLQQNVSPPSLTFSEQQSSLGEVINTICVNFLLYVVLIIVFYMLVRFYLEEETTTSRDVLGVESDADAETESEAEIDKLGGSGADVTADTDGLLRLDRRSKSTQGRDQGVSKSFLNVSQWGMCFMYCRIPSYAFTLPSR